MGYFRKHCFALAFVVLAAFLAVLTAESFHHHGASGKSDPNCSLCSWQLNDSHAVTPSLPALFFLLLASVSLFIFKPSFTSFTFIAASGRSPPVLL